MDHVAEPVDDAQSPKRKAPVGVDANVPSVARVYDALLGGKDNFAVDRAIADQLMKLTPGGANVPIYNRAVLGRGVRHMISQGIDQFIDLGAGLPTVQNTHEVAQRENPEAKVVYVDNDPMVLVHGRALLAENGNTTVITADFCDPDEVLNNRDLRALIDFDRPVGLLMVAVLHHLDDAQRPAELVARYLEAIPSGSFVFITHFIDGGEETAEIERVLLTDLGSGRFRSFDEVRGFFDGMELLEPGVVYNPLWRPDPGDVVPEPMSFAGKIIGAGLGRKP
ncbi:SAM-dependent methyltransferase [Plantactinospora sp. KBS50]|uniref:SAM-dependent methyltransferase n=1 Tax=Plantactinospora sp. KBS50 TaxID=2024580 RepID=UPI000BAAB8BE|nr:SAM-dependent methyltransferase [Plantactinospora sp. KBS50]ASW57631.1 SAM-dependent methyltransferase [Plantactinospora sp. KBS50]